MQNAKQLLVWIIVTLNVTFVLKRNNYFYIVLKSKETLLNVILTK